MNLSSALTSYTWPNQNYEIKIGGRHARLGTGQKLEGGGGLVHFYFGLPVLGRPSPFQVQKEC